MLRCLDSDLSRSRVFVFNYQFKSVQFANHEPVLFLSPIGSLLVGQLVFRTWNRSETKLDSMANTVTSTGLRILPKPSPR
jgi:hypothetical protein